MLEDARSASGLSSSRILGVVAALVALLVAADVSNRFFRLGAEEFLTLDAESSPGTWGASALFLLAALASYAHARLFRTASISWYCLALLMVVCSIDEIAMIHERIEVHVGWRWSLYVIQPLLGVGAVVVLIAISRSLRGRDRLLMGAAAGALILGQLEESSDNRLNVAFLEGALDVGEEVMELALSTLVLACALPHVWRCIAPVFQSEHERDSS